MEVIIKKKTEDILNKWEIQHNALEQVSTICDSMERLSKLLELDKEGVDRIGKWRNENIKIPW